MCEPVPGSPTVTCGCRRGSCIPAPRRGSWPTASWRQGGWNPGGGCGTLLRHQPGGLQGRGRPAAAALRGTCRVRTAVAPCQGSQVSWRPGPCGSSSQPSTRLRVRATSSLCRDESTSGGREKVVSSSWLKFGSKMLATCKESPRVNR